MTHVSQKPAFADSRAARLVAMLLIAAGIAVIAWHHRADILPRPEPETAANPELFACISERTAQVAGMLADGVIDEGRANSFRARAIQFCEQQFPPDEGQ